MNDDENLVTLTPGGAGGRRRTGAARQPSVARPGGQPIASNRAVSEPARSLVSGMAHCFNNLFQALLSRAELLRAMTLPGRHAADAAEALAADVLRGAEVVRQLILIARERARRCERVDLNEIVVVVLSRSGCPAARYDDVAPVLAAEPCWIEADREALERAVGGLVANARDYSPAAGQVILRTYCDGDVVCLEVTDGGPGVPEGVKEKIYEPFFTTRRADGHDGLGLSVAAAVVAAHGGRLELDTSPATGTTFRVILPAPSSSSEV